MYYSEPKRKAVDLLVGVILDVDEVVGHGLVGELMQDGADWVKAPLHDQQLCLGLSLQFSTVQSQNHKISWYVPLLQQ